MIGTSIMIKSPIMLWAGPECCNDCQQLRRAAMDYCQQISSYILDRLNYKGNMREICCSSGAVSGAQCSDVQSCFAIQQLSWSLNSGAKGLLTISPGIYIQI